MGVLVATSCIAALESTVWTLAAWFEAFYIRIFANNKPQVNHSVCHMTDSESCTAWRCYNCVGVWALLLTVNFKILSKYGYRRLRNMRMRSMLQPRSTRTRALRRSIRALSHRSSVSAHVYVLSLFSLQERQKACLKRNY